MQQRAVEPPGVTQEFTKVLKEPDDLRQSNREQLSNASCPVNSNLFGSYLMDPGLSELEGHVRKYGIPANVKGKVLEVLGEIFFKLET